MDWKGGYFKQNVGTILHIDLLGAKQNPYPTRLLTEGCRFQLAHTSGSQGRLFLFLFGRVSWKIAAKGRSFESVHVCTRASGYTIVPDSTQNRGGWGPSRNLQMHFSHISNSMGHLSTSIRISWLQVVNSCKRL